MEIYVVKCFLKKTIIEGGKQKIYKLFGEKKEYQHNNHLNGMNWYESTAFIFCTLMKLMENKN